MKKFTSLLLAIVMLSSCFTFVGCIDPSDDIKMKEAYLRQFGIKDVKAEDVIIDYDAGTYNGARVVMLDAEWHDPEKWVEQLGSYSITYYDSNRLYAYKDGVFITLSEAYENSSLSIDDLSIIAYKYENDIRMYIDICDIYDFDKSEYEELDWSNNNIYNSVTIWMDIRSVEGIWEL